MRVQIGQEDGQSKLQNQDERNSEIEFGMLGLVAEDVHSEESTGASAEDGRENQSPFWDSPMAFACLVFVDSV